jgi:hypothetical protein
MLKRISNFSFQDAEAKNVPSWPYPHSQGRRRPFVSPLDLSKMSAGIELKKPRGSSSVTRAIAVCVCVCVCV